MGWADWLTITGGAVSAWGAIKGGQEADEYYTQAAAIQRQNANIQRQNNIWQAEAVANQAQWEKDKADIDYQRAAISYQWAEYETAYKIFQAEEEARFDAYMAALSRQQGEDIYNTTVDIATGLYQGEKAVAKEREGLAKEKATLEYEQKMDTLRHVVAETAAKGGKSGFQINAGSFMSALRDQTAYGTGIYSTERRISDEAAELDTKATLMNADAEFRTRLLNAETGRQNKEADAMRYDLSGKIALEGGKLAALGLGLAGETFGLAGKAYGIAEEQYGWGMDRSRFLKGQAEQVYGSDMAQAGLTEGRGRSARNASWIVAAGNFLSAFGKQRYGHD